MLNKSVLSLIVCKMINWLNKYEKSEHYIVDGNATGSDAYSSFDQPVGIAVENDTNIYITDAKYGSIKLVTTISGTINFLIYLQKIYAAFSVHSKNDTVVRQSLETCKELLNQSNTFIKGTVDKVKETCNISNLLQ
jgi:hypothetical protein